MSCRFTGQGCVVRLFGFPVYGRYTLDSIKIEIRILCVLVVNQTCNARLYDIQRSRGEALSGTGN